MKSSVGKSAFQRNTYHNADGITTFSYTIQPTAQPMLTWLVGQGAAKQNNTPFMVGDVVDGQPLSKGTIQITAYKNNAPFSTAWDQTYFLMSPYSPSYVAPAPNSYAVQQEMERVRQREEQLNQRERRDRMLRKKSKAKAEDEDTEAPVATPAPVAAPSLGSTEVAKPGLSTGAIIGISVGVLALTAAGIAFAMRKKKG